MKAIRLYQRGGPDTLTLEDIETPTPSVGEVLIQVAAAGVNYSDVGQRNGNYPNQAKLPLTMGNEAAGIVVKCGPDVAAPVVGTRIVALVDGGYAQYAIAKADSIVPIPDNVSFAQATVIPIQGQTAYLALTKAGHFQQGERVLINAAAGGVGSLAVQLAKILGASRVIATTTKDEKLGFIRDLGADIAINTTKGDLLEQVMRATQGQGVDVVLESVGSTIGQQSILCLAPFGRMVVFGALANEPTGLVAQMLIPKGLSLIGYNTPLQPLADQMRASQTMMQYIADGKINVILEHSFPLAQAAEAHRALERGQTRGKVVLTI